MNTQTTITDIAGKQHTLIIRQTSPEHYSARLGNYTASGATTEAVAQEIVSGINGDHPKHFEQKTAEHQQELLSWITANLRPGTRGKTERYSSYYLKHVAEQYMPSGYVSNAEMKGALLKAGYTPAKDAEVTSLDYAINWDFVLERGLPEKLDLRTRR